MRRCNPSRCRSSSTTTCAMAFDRGPFVLVELILDVDLRWDQIDFTHAVLHVRYASVAGLPRRPACADRVPNKTRTLEGVR